MTLTWTWWGVPGIQATPEYIDQRKLTVYRAALEGAYEDGEVTSKERSIQKPFASNWGSTSVKRRSWKARSVVPQRRLNPSERSSTLWSLPTERREVLPTSR